MFLEHDQTRGTSVSYDFEEKKKFPPVGEGGLCR